MIYLYHGDDEFTRTENVSALKATVMQPGLGDLNIVELDGRRLTLGELTAACDTLPFLAAVRLVIVRDLLLRFGVEGAAEKHAEGDAALGKALIAYLPRVPPSTQLAFDDSRPLAAANVALKWAATAVGCQVRACRGLNPNRAEDLAALEGWLRTRAKVKGVDIDRNAIALLVERVGSNLRALDMELDKLAGLVAYRRGITAGDVQAVVTASREDEIWGLMDALGARQRQQALHLVAQQFEQGEHELYLLTMITRQVRQLLITKEIEQSQGRSKAAVAKAAKVREFAAERLLKQAERFSTAELERLLQRALELDVGIKTGRQSGRLGIEMLVLEICQAAPPPLAERHQGSSRLRTR